MVPYSKVSCNDCQLLEINLVLWGIFTEEYCIVQYSMYEYIEALEKKCGQFIQVLL